MIPRGLKFPSEGEITVLGFLYTLLVICLFGLGMYIFFLSFNQPPAKSDLAAKARWVGPCRMTVAVAMKPSWIIAAVNWIALRFNRSGH